MQGMASLAVMLFVLSVYLIPVNSSAAEASLTCAPLQTGKVTLCIRSQTDGDKSWELVTDTRVILNGVPDIVGDIRGMMLSPDQRYLLIQSLSPNLERLLVLDISNLLVAGSTEPRHDFGLPIGTMTLMGWEGNQLRVKSRYDLNDDCMESVGDPRVFLLDLDTGHFSLDLGKPALKQ